MPTTHEQDYDFRIRGALRGRVDEVVIDADRVSYAGYGYDRSRRRPVTYLDGERASAWPLVVLLIAAMGFGTIWYYAPPIELSKKVTVVVKEIVKGSTPNTYTTGWEGWRSPCKWEDTHC